MAWSSGGFSGGVGSNLTPEQQALIARSGITPPTNNFRNLGNMTGASSVDPQTAAVNAARDAQGAADYKSKLAALAKANGDKNLFTQMGGQVDPNDPWGFYRESAGNELSTFIGGEDPSNFYKNKLKQMSTGEFSPDDPSYKFRLEQGQQTLERSLAARGLLNSGNAAIELQQYGQESASQEYAAQFDRMLQGLSGVSAQYDSQFSRLAKMAGIDLNPAASSQLGVQAGANAVANRGNKLNYKAKMSELEQEAGLYDAYNQGIADEFAPRGGSMNSPAYSLQGGGYLQGGG